MRILYLVFIFFTNIFIFNPNLGLAENNIKLKIVVIVNDHAITNIDINNQINFIKSMYNNENFENKQIYSSALNNLIYEVLKNDEIKKNNLITDENKIKEKYNIILQDLQKNNRSLDEDFKKELFKKVKIEAEWNELVLKKNYWKININIKEIEEKLKENKKNINNEKLFLEKDKLISLEKNKKLQIYSNKYLEDLKENSLIKYFK